MQNKKYSVELLQLNYFHQTKRSMNKILNHFFYPASICVAGASVKEKSIGYEILKSIKNYGYTGKIYPVNPKAESILGFTCYKTIEEINEEISLGIIVVPKHSVEKTIDSLLKKNVKAIILITAGFKETGRDGEQLEKFLVQKVKNAGGRIVGPNCMGVINTFKETKLNATFVAEKPATGTTAFLSQSGAIAAAILNSLRETDIRFGHFISVGNKADVSENDFLNYWFSKQEIQTLTFYLESFVDGQKFIRTVHESKNRKPVIVLKAGRTESGKKAAASHTGAMGTSDRVVEAVFNQFGIIRAENLNDLFNTSKGFENFPVPAANNIAVVTNAGGPAILTVDSLEPNNLRLATLSENTKSKIRKIIRPEGSANNPVDLLPGGSAEEYKKVIEILLEDKLVDAVISIFVEPVMMPAFEVIETINSIKNSKPVFQVVMPLPEFWNEYRINSKRFVPLFRNPEDPAKVISNILFFHNYKPQKRLEPKNIAFVFQSDGFLQQNELNKLCSYYNLPLINSSFIPIEKFDGNFNSLNYPVVLKGISPNVIHKSEFKAVKLDIKGKDELISAASEMKLEFLKNNMILNGYLIQPYVKAKHELLIGGFRDSSFGPVIMFGLGGKYVEFFEDTSIKSAYLSDDDLDSIINETKIGKILKGVRAEAPVNERELKEIIKSSARLMLDNPSIKEFDFNPLVVTENNRFFIVDARVRV